MKIYFYSLFLIFLLAGSKLYSQNILLQSGPMIGYCETKEVLLWVQTTCESDVKFSYTDTLTKITHFTETLHTKKENSFIAKLIADSLSPGSTYQYNLYLNNKLIELPKKRYFSTKKINYGINTPEIRFATGSCAYINESGFIDSSRTGGGYEIFESIARQKPEFMLWLGDNVYYRLGEWFTERGLRHRNTDTRSLLEMQNLLSSSGNYAIWDDHDYAGKDGNRSFSMKQKSLEVFKDFWANPEFSNDKFTGITSTFTYYDCDFFLLDNRYNRTPDNVNEVNKSMLGKEQLAWFKDVLIESKAKIKFVAMGGQFLSTSKEAETYSNFGFDIERKEIIDFIVSNKIMNVIFISGDRHFSEISVFKEKGITIYDITVSPFTSVAASEDYISKLTNELRVPGSIIAKRNFATFSISGTKQNRILEINYFDTNGTKIFNYEIKTEN